MSDYKNTLRTGDQVLDVSTNRRGVVHAQPREKSVMISVIYDGTTTPRPLYVGDLRYIVDGKPEEEAPIEGPLPMRPETAQPPRQPRGTSLHEPRQQMLHPRDLMTPLMVLEEREAQIKQEMSGLEERFKVLRAESERNLKAIAVLKA